MFNSKLRPIVIPQYEHGRMAGELARHWGNNRFGRPNLEFDSFVSGVALHDWHYGFGDTLPILEAAEADWLAMARLGLDLRLHDATADLVAKLHLRRLLSYDPSPPRRAMMAEIDDYVAARLPKTGQKLADFERADSITHFCDNVAFHFAFEAHFEGAVKVDSQGSGMIEINYRLQPQGKVAVDPWPFSVPLISGIILGFQAEGYPQRLEPVIVPYRLGEPSY